MGVTRVSHDTPKSAVGDSADSESPESPFAQTLVDFIAERSESPMALIGDEHEVLLPAAGLMLLVAKGGKGKTTLVVELALHLASGVDWLGFTVSRPLRVLFIENEGPREPFRAKLEIKRGLWEHEIRGELFIHSLDWGAFSLADETAHAGLRAFIELQNIDVVIGDPLDSLGMTGVGSPEDVRGLMALMHRVGLHRNVAFLLLHHPHKGEASDPLDEASGAWGGKPDTQLNLEKRSGDRARLSFPKVRWSRRGARAAYLLGFDPDTESFSVVHEEDEEERDHDAEILELLTDGCWRTPKEVAAPAEKGGIGANVDLVKDRLAKRPDLFVSRTGEAAKALDRHPTATIWQLVDNEDQTQLAA
jgi:AAA domain